jgi:DNA-binding LacI/PurR family transcriptional regulator
MPTLEDVARKAGVSTATVSKVLSNTPYFTEATRAKVMQAVKDVGYVPNLAARALSSGKTGIIAVVFPYVYDSIFTDPLVLRIIEGIEAECSQRGYNLLLSAPRLVEGADDDHYLKLIQSGYMDGVIALDNVPFASVLEPVMKKGIPAVNIGYRACDFSVRSDDYSGGFQLMEHILQLGHRKIGIITVPTNLNFTIGRRMDGLRDAALAAGVQFEYLPQAEGDFSVAGGADCAASLLQQHPDLTALIGLNDRMAMGAIQQAHRLGKRVPEQLTIVGYDDIPTAAIMVPSLTTINQQALTLGYEACRMLFEVLNGQSPESRVIPVELVVRGSSAPPFNRF